jgi:hypothetical protein
MFNLILATQTGYQEKAVTLKVKNLLDSLLFEFLSSETTRNFVEEKT